MQTIGRSTRYEGQPTVEQRVVFGIKEIFELTSKILSIGYEGRSVDELIEILKSYHIEKLLDVRERPISRKKGLSKTKLAASLAQADIIYQHVRSAGNPYRKAQGDIEHCLSLYASYLDEHPEVVELVATESEGVNVAFLCYEREHKHCHRSVLLDAVRQIELQAQVVKVE